LGQGAVRGIPAWAFVPDLFLRAKVEALARGAGVDVRFFGTPDELVGALGEARLASAPPALVIADLSDPGGRGLLLLERLARVSSPPTLGFYSHVEDHVRQRALDLGVTRVVPRSAFVLRFADLVRQTIA
jgi:DNA-binding NarL/FixJ family response regulator